MNDHNSWPPEPIFNPMAAVQSAEVVDYRRSLRWAVASLTVYGFAMLLWCGVAGVAVTSLQNHIPSVYLGMGALGATLLLFVSFGLGIPARRSRIGAAALALSGVGAFFSTAIIVVALVVASAHSSGH